MFFLAFTQRDLRQRPPGWGGGVTVLQPLISYNGVQTARYVSWEGDEMATNTRRALAIAGLVGLSVLASACGASSGAKVAQIGTTTSASSSGSSGASGSGDPRAYSSCMRSHGVANFPDPDGKGRLLITSGAAANGKKTGLDVNSSLFKRAQQACQRLLPNGGRPTTAQRAKEQQTMLKFAQCMRSHGVPKFPDPKAGGALVLGVKAGVDPNTPQFKAAQQICQKLVPGSPLASGPVSEAAP